MKKLMCLIVFIVAIWASFSSARTISIIYGGVSIRAPDALTDTQIEKCQKYAQKTGIPLSFWREESTEIKNNLNTVAANGIFFSNSAGAALGAEYIRGEAPFSSDSSACAISQELSEKLFKSTDVIGLLVYCGKNEYIIRGVFKGYGRNEVLINADSGFNCIELEGAYSTDDVQSFLAICGVQGAQIIYAHSISSFLNFFRLLPCFTAFILMLLELLKEAKRLTSQMRELILFIAAFIFAVSLVYLLKSLPTWLLPPTLSSASAWGGIFTLLKEQTLSYLSITPAIKDTAVRLLIFKCTAFSLISAYFSAKLFKGRKSSITGITSISKDSL